MPHPFHADILPHFRHRGAVRGVDQHYTHEAKGHDDEAGPEDGVQLANDLVNGQEGGDKVVNQHDSQPEVGI